jgi:hypothetical protein
MRWLIILFFLAVTRITAFSDYTAERGFTRLADALVFIDHELDAGDWKTLNHSLYPPLQTHDPNRSEWAQLKEDRGNLCLARVYADQDFPPTDLEFDIKIPRFQLEGESRVRFIKANGSWRINAAYFTR